MRELDLPVTLVREPDEADVVITLRNYFKQKAPALRESEERGLPIFVLKSNTLIQVESALTSIFALEIDPRYGPNPSSSRRRTHTSGACSIRWPSAQTSCRNRAGANRTDEFVSIRTAPAPNAANPVSVRVPQP